MFACYELSCPRNWINLTARIYYSLRGIHQGACDLTYATQKFKLNLQHIIVLQHLKEKKKEKREN